MKRMVFVLAGAGVMAGCDRPVAAPVEPAPAPRLGVTGNAVVAVASGSGVYDLSSAGVPNGSFIFGVIGFPNGNATGVFRQRRETPAGAVDFTGNATCLAVDPVNHRAWIGGLITRNNSTDPAFLTPVHEVGDAIRFRVVDYRGTEQGPPDRSTVLGFEGGGIFSPVDYCGSRPWPAGDARTWAVIKGGLIVKP